MKRYFRMPSERLLEARSHGIDPLMLRHADLDPRLDEIAQDVVAAIKKVRDHLGAGLVESVYLTCLARELERRGRVVDREVRVPIHYKGEVLQRTFRIDLIVDQALVIEGKAVEDLHPTHFAQTLTYLRLSGKKLGFLVNFNAVPLRNGIHRLVRPDR